MYMATAIVAYGPYVFWCLLTFSRVDTGHLLRVISWSFVELQGALSALVYVSQSHHLRRMARHVSRSVDDADRGTGARVEETHRDASDPSMGLRASPSGLSFSVAFGDVSEIDAVDPCTSAESSFQRGEAPASSSDSPPRAHRSTEPPIDSLQLLQEQLLQDAYEEDEDEADEEPAEERAPDSEMTQEEGCGAGASSAAPQPRRPATPAWRQRMERAQRRQAQRRAAIASWESSQPQSSGCGL